MVLGLQDLFCKHFSNSLFIFTNAIKITMFDVALSSAGAQVVLVTSSHEQYPPENMIDG